MRFWLNGVAADEIAIADRGLSLGDGHFTTVKVVNGAMELWPLHRQRLANANALLGFAAIDWERIDAELKAVIADVELGCLRITLTRGCSGRGYQGKWGVDATRIYSVSDFPSHYGQWQRQGITVDIATTRLSFGGPLVGVKTIGRAEQVVIKHELTRSPADDLIVLDPFDNVIEASAGNLFVVIDGTVVTPQLSHSGIAGVMRQRLLADIAELGYQVQVRPLKLAELKHCQQAIICNCLMGVVPVNYIGQQHLTLHSLATSLQGHYDPLV
ncbi:aminodeoxychorismate lyase [Ferrimonas lipolytica]|uniref:Aminodeoxychorismate lyase n=1 Tax=Ferrimonas lipolytica TaxID=2724191 RepID=A0A6H1UDX9_9GAMM|nr:aminodeoxychorismate lyase [Ferrimonas lipolytica]QIZ76543.1 aminodeoxychorismate lyase [Ferrimonas lipolytica]